MRGTIDLVYNPAAGSFRSSRLAALTLALEAQEFRVSQIGTRRDGVELSPAADIVCVLGGDGTARLVAGALGARIEEVGFAIAPSGTINLIARELGYSPDPELLALQIAQAWDAGRESWLRSPMFQFAGEPVLACFSMGPDSLAVAGVSTGLKARIGRYAYVVSAFRLLWNWPNERFTVRFERADGTAGEAQAQAVFAARGRYYAGSYVLSPKAGMASEAMELVLLQGAGRLQYAAFALAIALRLSPEKRRLARIESVRWFECEGSDVPAQVDGDPAGPNTARVEPSGLAVHYCA